MLLPARGRPAHLRESIDSVFDLAAKPDDVEVLVRLDDNDPHLTEELQVLGSYPMAAKVLVDSGERLGYSRMHEYYNQLAALGFSHGAEWLFLWNDDITMITRHWDVILREAPLFAVQFPRRDITKTTDYTLPVVGRPIYEALGHLSMNAYCDAWISDYSAFAGTSVVRDDIVFLHHRLNDDTLKEQADGGREWHKFTEAEQMRMRRADMDAVIAAPWYASRFDGWITEDVYHNVDYIKLAAGEMRAKSVILRGRR